MLRRLEYAHPHHRGIPESGSDLSAAVADALGIPQDSIRSSRLVRRTLDARRSQRVPMWRVTAEAELPEALPKRVLNATTAAPESPRPIESPRTTRDQGPIVVVGAGPAGLFAALHLVEHGAHVILVERGKAVEERSRDFGRFRGRGELDPESNLCFGEGGAGTYSDGKLTCRKKDPTREEVLSKLVQMGGPERILVEAKPHVGTDRLYRILKSIRASLVERGVELRYGHRVVDLHFRSGRLYAVELEPGGVLECRAAVLATGHSARDMFELLIAKGVDIEAKPFAVGVRAEHPQRLIDEAQYHRSGPRPPTLPPADYRLTHTEDGRGVYSFCMCPGGMIVPTATEPETVVVNGMSSAKRGSAYANSGVVVQVTPADFESWGFGHDALAGVRFQQHLERTAYRLGGGRYRAPATRVDDFLARRASGRLAPSHFRPGLTSANLDELLPPATTEALRSALRQFDRRVRGYASAEANLVGVESRTSSPVRVPRHPDSKEVAGLCGVYVAGEGPGHAGGIMSAALDGLRVAHGLLLCAAGG